jgi:hypothetical protein
MQEPAEFLKDVMIHPNFQPRIIEWLKPWRLKTYVDILIVVDEEIKTTPSNGFGIASVIELIRNTQVGCMKFRVDIALRVDAPFSVSNNPTPTEPKYTGFRFNARHNNADVIDKYEQIWCFGFKPNNSGSEDDSIIDEDFALPTTNAELEKLDHWMTEKKGGLFGTGDHHFLGASMCRKIPRLGTMRRWTNADGVPPQFTSKRIDTLRPPAPVSDYRAGGSSFLGNLAHQGDLTVQPIRWTTWKSVGWPLLLRQRRPHPVLCHPTLGPINVMPDHAHEGLCVPFPDLKKNKQFSNDLEYPDAIDGGRKPAPEIIAYGSNLDSDDWNFAKGEQPGRDNNPMISVYDGHRADVGRVATDSTWHHWMDVNINQIKAANNNDWKKISRYYINLAIWLNPPGFSTKCLYLSIIASHFEYVGFQEFHPKATAHELGQMLREHLIKQYGPCWVTERIWEIPVELEIIPPKELLELAEKFKNSRLDNDFFEELLLGHMVKATMDEAENLKRSKPGDIEPLNVPEELFKQSFSQAIESFAESNEKLFEIDRESLNIFKSMM